MVILVAAERIDWPTTALWLGLLAAAIIGAAVAVVFIRRGIRMDRTASPAFTLQDLREMRARGDLTEEEYEAARTIALGKAADPKRPS